jgi:hypothetical protein
MTKPSLCSGNGGGKGTEAAHRRFLKSLLGVTLQDRESKGNIRDCKLVV